MYQKTQVGTAMLVVIAIAYAIEFLVTVSNGPSSGVFVASIVLACIGLVFSTMTIRVSTDGVEWWFTFGILRQRVSLAEIQFAVTKKVTLLNGLGIRTDGRNWLWIVNGTDAVQLDMRNGRRIMLGSPEAQTVTLFIDKLLNGA
jgi:hypothetical protein